MFHIVCRIVLHSVCTLYNKYVTLFVQGTHHIVCTGKLQTSCTVNTSKFKSQRGKESESKQGKIV